MNYKRISLGDLAGGVGGNIIDIVRSFSVDSKGKITVLTTWLSLNDHKRWANRLVNLNKMSGRLIQARRYKNWCITREHNITGDLKDGFRDNFIADTTFAYEFTFEAGEFNLNDFATIEFGGTKEQ